MPIPAEQTAPEDIGTTGTSVVLATTITTAAAIRPICIQVVSALTTGLFLTANPQTAKPPDNNSQTSDNSGKTCHSHGKRSVHQSGCQWFRHHRPCSLVQEQLLCACESACRQTFRSGWPCQRQTGTACDSAETATCGIRLYRTAKAAIWIAYVIFIPYSQRQSLSQNGLLYLTNGMVFPVILPWMKGFLKSEIGISFLPAPSA